MFHLIEGFGIHRLRVRSIVGQKTPSSLVSRSAVDTRPSTPLPGPATARRDDGVRAGGDRFTANKLRLPVVRFASGEEVIIERYTWTLNGASFRQLPLELGWVLSIHKSQVCPDPRDIVISPSPYSPPPSSLLSSSAVYERRAKVPSLACVTSRAHARPNGVPPSTRHQQPPPLPCPLLPCSVLSACNPTPLPTFARSHGFVW